MFSSKAICLAASIMLAVSPATTCAVLAADPQLNFKIYSPQDPPAESPSADADAAKSDVSDSSSAATSSASAPADSSIFEEESAKSAPVVAPAKETPVVDTTPTSASAPAESLAEPTAEPVAETTSPAATETTAESVPESKVETSTTTTTSSVATKDAKVLQGYIRVVPTGTKIPIVMDTAVDSDTSQEGDEFSARTSEDLTIDGSTVVPAGSIIKGRIATLNSPRALNRSGSVALKFDNITTPDNRQIPLVATIVARGGVVHARRGMKDIAIDTGTVALPFVAGLAIGALAGNSSSSSNSVNNNNSSSGMSKGAAAALGAGIGLAVGIAVLCAKKGKKIEVRPGDELKIELAEELRMPTM